MCVGGPPPPAICLLFLSLFSVFPALGVGFVVLFCDAQVLLSKTSFYVVGTH